MNNETYNLLYEKIKDNFDFPESLHTIKIISPHIIPISLMSRLKCYNCGLYNRAILCPPLLYETYPMFSTMNKTKKFINSFDVAIVLIFKNDGTKSWLVDKNKLNHIEFKKKVGKELKGTEVSQSRELTRLTKKLSVRMVKNNIATKTFGLIAGHCDLCAFKCPNRDNPPCKKGGMPSLEAIMVDVHMLLEKLHIRYEYPVINYLTSVTMVLAKIKN